MDPALIVARWLLILGCSGAALVPVGLGRSDSFVAVQSELRALSFATVMIPQHASPSEDALPAIGLAGESRAVESSGAATVSTKPAPVDLRFIEAAPVPLAPVRVRIPAQDIDAQIVPVGISPSGEMEAPEGYDDVGWYRHGARPGESGKAVLAGHLDSQTGPAVFFRLGALQPGDTIEVQFDGEAAVRVFTVRELAQYPVDGAPLAEIFGAVDQPELVLITCAGEFEGAEAGYSERVVVYAELASGS